jgi:hypothetical protein
MEPSKSGKSELKTNIAKPIKWIGAFLKICFLLILAGLKRAWLFVKPAAVRLLSGAEQTITSSAPFPSAGASGRA